MDWDLQLALGAGLAPVTLALPGGAVEVCGRGSELWRVQGRDFLLPSPATLRVRPGLPAEPLLLRLSTPVVLPPAATLEGTVAIPVEAVVEAAVPSGTVTLCTVTPPALQRRLGFGPVDQAMVARALDVAFTPGAPPEPGPEGLALLPMRLTGPRRASATLTRLLVPAGVLSLAARGPRLLASRLDVAVREGDVAAVEVEPGLLEPGLTHRAGPDPDAPRGLAGAVRRLLGRS